MGKRKTVTTVEADETELEVPTGAGNLPPDPDEQAEQDIIDELKKLGGDDGVKWSVHKIAGKPGERGGWCADYDTAGLSLDAIRESFGGGRYRIQGTKLSGGAWVARRLIEIMDMPKAPGTAAGATAGGIDVAALAAALKPAGDGGMLALIMKMMESNTQQMTALFNSLKNDGGNKQPSAMELVALIKALQPAKDDKSSVDLLLEGVRLAREFGSGGGGADWMDLARSGLEAIKPAIEAQAAARMAQPALPAPPGQPAVPALAPPTTPQPAPAAAPEGNPMLQQLAWLKAQVNLLVGQAAKNAAGKGGDPELYAEIMLDNLPAFITQEQIFERISAPDAVAQLAQIDARVNQYLPWFTQFRQAVMDFFIDEDTPGGDDTPASA